MAPRISIVIPTFNRRERLEACLRSLESQTARGAFEVVVVVDGSTDGTVEFLRDYGASYPLRHVFQENRGLSAARNRGNREVACDLILCIDDDMIASPELVAEHLASHRDHPGKLVQGSLGIHASVPRTPFMRYEERRLADFDRRQRERPLDIVGEDVSGGNTSMARTLFDAVGGFKESLKDLSDTDGELAYRLEKRGVGIVYNTNARADLTYVKDLDARLREAVLYGRTYVDTLQEFPETIWRFSPFVHDTGSTARNLMRRHLARRASSSGFPGYERGLAVLISAAEKLRLRALTEPLYRLAIDYHFWRGVDLESGGRMADFVPRPIPILCYHNVSDVRTPSFRSYVLPVERFRRQIERLERWGYRGISLDALHAYLERGEPLPPRPVVITFDDGYSELETTATPRLVEGGHAHTHFLNTDKIGGTTDWIERASDLPILSREAVRRMARDHAGLVDFQAHGRSHRSLGGLDAGTVRDEVGGSIEALEAILESPVRYMAYPYGDYDETTPDVMATLPLRCSFTVDQGLCRPGQPMHRLPRVEIFTGDNAFDFYCKVRFGWSPISRLATYPFRRTLRRKLRALAGRSA